MQLRQLTPRGGGGGGGFQIFVFLFCFVQVLPAPPPGLWRVCYALSLFLHLFLPHVHTPICTKRSFSLFFTLAAYMLGLTGVKSLPWGWGTGLPLLPNPSACQAFPLTHLAYNPRLFPPLIIVRHIALMLHQPAFVRPF